MRDRELELKEGRFSETQEEIQLLGDLHKEFSRLDHVWSNDGWDLDQSRQFSMKDAITTSNSHVFLPKTMTKIVREAQEPMLIGTKLLKRINFKFGTQIEFPAVGATGQADLVAELGEYPRLSPAISGATVVARIGKYGIAVDFSEEILRYSIYDVYNMMLELAARDLARKKEQVIFTFLLEQGTVVFDNTNWNDASASIKGPTTGRDRKGKGNGSMTMDDLFEMFAHLIHQGYTPNALMMHPMTWLMWVKDPILRTFALNSGGGTWFASWSGNAAVPDPWSPHGGMGVAKGRNVGKAADNNKWDFNWEAQQTHPYVPSYFPVPLKIIVTPLMPYDWSTGLTNVMMMDTNNLGVLVVDEDPTTQKWNKDEVDLTSVKIRERYGVAVLNEGQAIAVAKGIKVNAYNQVVDVPTTMLDVQNLEDIGFNVNVLD